jgi:hypothetical protein
MMVLLGAGWRNRAFTSRRARARCYESDALVSFVDCTFGTSPEVVFTGAAPGVVRVDARSNYLWDAAGGSVTNGSVVVEALL